MVLGKLDAIARYRVTLPEGSSTLKLSYGGTVNFPLSSPEEEYARGIIETAGTVNGDGVYLAGGTLWYPYFSDELVSFELTAAAPDGWRLISQGNGSSQRTKRAGAVGFGRPGGRDLPGRRPADTVRSPSRRSGPRRRT